MIEENKDDLMIHMLSNFKDKFRDEIDAMEKHFIEKFEEQLVENTQLKIQNEILKKYREMYFNLAGAIQGVGKNEEE